MNLPLPSRSLLELHATCAQVAHLSGGSSYIDLVYNDLEGGLRVLAGDGSSIDALKHAFLSLSSYQIDVEA